ncbi:uncharacterized protein LOC108117656 [Drosophila eugracilis]|uniref:uncharacterized protein LOC108117656 n=1 Tax=Drosophila eugracilis TaxID=29029 RepID=UPI0007E5C259|nr:uncharacterized protein LOC108117656 [Drosophila eugracilis]
MSWRLSTICVLICVLVAYVVSFRAQNYKNSFPDKSFYNPLNGQQLEPLTVNGNIVELSHVWQQPCFCSSFACRCCLGLAFGFGESFKQRLCSFLEYSRTDMGLRLGIELNQRTLANFQFSARTPPDYCLPLLLPPSLVCCLRLYEIQTFDEFNMKVCLSVVFKVLTSQFLEYRFNCFRFGTNGVLLERVAGPETEK